MKTPSKIAKALYILSKSKETKMVSKVFAKYTKDKHLESMLPKIVEHLKNFSEKDSAYNTAFVKTAFKLGTESEDKIRSFVGMDNKSKIESKVDKNLVGGFEVRYKGFLYDASIKNSLKKLKEAIINQQ